MKAARSNMHRAKLTEEQVKEIRKLHAMGVRPGIIREMLNLQIKRNAMSRVVNYETWRHVLD
jgi:hypothetical protein